jgi:hypothetical protein
MTPQQKALQDCIEALEYAQTGNRRPEVIGVAITQAKQALEVQAQGDALSSFQGGQWWVSELDAMAKNGTPDQKRAVAVVRNLLRVIATHPQASEPAESAVEAIVKLQGEPFAWVSVKDRLPPTVRGVSYRQLTTGVVLVRHSDRPDYPITAHAVLGDGLGVGIAIPTEGASDHPEIAWYSATSIDKNNPFDKKDQNYERFLPKIFGSKITHWMPLPAAPEAK